MLLPVKQATVGPPISLTYTSLTGPADEIWKGVCKLMEFKVALPVGYFGDVKIQVRLGFLLPNVEKPCKKNCYRDRLLNWH